MTDTKTNGKMEAQREVALLDQLLEGGQKPEDLLARGGAFNPLRKQLIGRMLGAELDTHPGYTKSEPPVAGDGNHRNG